MQSVLIGSVCVLILLLCVCVCVPSAIPGLARATSEMILGGSGEGLERPPCLSLSTAPTLGWPLLPICHPALVRPPERLGPSGETGGVAGVRGSVKL